MWFKRVLSDTTRQEMKKTEETGLGRLEGEGEEEHATLETGGGSLTDLDIID